jgi:hypothetical protein
MNLRKEQKIGISAAIILAALLWIVSRGRDIDPGELAMAKCYALSNKPVASLSANDLEDLRACRDAGMK